MKFNFLYRRARFLTAFTALCLGFANILFADNKPDFASMTDVNIKKSSFFDYLYPMIVEENRKILIERKQLLNVKTVTPEIIRICNKYSNECDGLDKSQINQLLTRVDIVPPSLALAQAANESGWGTSRFAVKANNFFGQWCFTKNCGLVPKNRSKNMTHEVRKFTSVQDSVAAYIHNLNTGHAYKALRKLRAKIRTKGEQLSSTQLAGGLLAYSERGHDYVKEIQSMIRYNKLVNKYDEPFMQMLP